MPVEITAHRLPVLLVLVTGIGRSMDPDQAATVANIRNQVVDQPLMPRLQRLPVFRGKVLSLLAGRHEEILRRVDNQHRVELFECFRLEMGRVVTDDGLVSAGVLAHSFQGTFAVRD